MTYFAENPIYTIKFIQRKCCLNGVNLHLEEFGLTSLKRMLLFLDIWIAY